MGLLLVLAAGLVLFPTVAGELEPVAVDEVASVTVEACETAVAPVEFGLEEASLGLESGEVALMAGCPNWTCTRHLDCAWECGGNRPNCSNWTGGTCAGTCICW